MKITRSDEVAVAHADHLFRHSSPRDGVVVVATLLGAAAMSGAAWVGALPVVVAAYGLLFLVLFGFIALRAYRRAGSPENWLLAVDGSRILVRLRSHLNVESAEDRALVVEVAATDLVGLRVTKSATKGHSAAGEPENVRSIFLELLLRDASSELADAVRAERERRVPGAVWRHYPVTLPDARTLRVEWRGKYARIRPPIEQAVAVLREFAPVLESNAEVIDLGTSGTRPVNADVERQLRLLAADGRTFDAMVLGARTYGLSQTEAGRPQSSGARPLSYLKIALVTLLALLLWVGVVVAGALFGWWRQPVAPTGDPQAFMRAAVDIIEHGNRGNTALVLIEDGAIRGEYYSTTADPVDRNTMFATASMSKWLTAWGVMKLVEDGKLDLDRPVEDYLTRWRLPPGQFDNRAVTTRRLLSHSAGLTDGLGFGHFRPDEALPTLEQSLAQPRASTGEPAAVMAGIEPGSTWRYSGGGYLILELLVEEVSGETFEGFMERTILQPLDMTRSGYSYLGDVENSAKSYDAEGRPAAIHRYASKAATGFSASAADMARFVLAQLPMVTDKPLAQETVDAMREPHATLRGVDIWGLGVMLYAPAASGHFVFGHDGANEPAMNASVRVNPDTGDGIVVLVTGSQTLASALGSHWVFWQTGLPDFLSIPGEIKRVAPALLGGAFVILLLAIGIGWRLRRAREPNDANVAAT